MNQFDMENEQAFQIVHNNPRRRGVIRDVGYIINTEQAQRFAAYEASQKRQDSDWRGPVMLIIATLMIIGLAVTAPI